MTYIQNKKIQNYVHNVDTSFTKKAISTAVEYYPGTEVTYTPTSGASSVIYECNLQTSWNPDNPGSYLCTRLQYSDDYAGESDPNNWTWNTINKTRMFEGDNGTVSDADWHNLCWLFILPAWSGERKLRLAGRSHSTSTEYTIGRSYRAVGSEGSGSCPFVSIYSII